ncbi:MAG: (d)CMP kinase [Chloroflexi bacterium]|nr:(d)CMP kinase [Chloroflexota bacterium]
MSLPSTIAVDGPASSGKSTVSFAVSRRIGYLFVDTGAFYRAITLLALEQHLDLDNFAEVSALAERAQIDITPELADDGRQYTVMTDGRDITAAIHAPEVDAAVSKVSAIPGVRAALLNTQRKIAARGRVIMAGRDIGTIVLPDADLKIYIDASLEERATRRYHQRASNGESADLDAIREAIRKRDEADSQRAISPLLRAPDAVYLDTSHLTQLEAIEAMIRILHEWSREKNHEQR